MKVHEMMTTDVCVVSPNNTLRDAAMLMEKMDIGSLPVGMNDRLVGIITDRDIAIRAVAQGKSPDTTVQETMSTDIKYCYEDEDVDHVARNMADLELRRMPVVNRDKRLVGVVSLSNFAYSGERKASDKLLKGVAAPH
jgi:CBS domain-containing protein